MPAHFQKQNLIARDHSAKSFLNRFGGGQQRGVFEETAKILFAGVLVGAVGELQVVGRFVADFKPFKVDDADKFRAAFPNLALLQFHGKSCLS
jgi:hypothetical protein